MARLTFQEMILKNVDIIILLFSFFDLVNKTALDPESRSFLENNEKCDDL